MLSKEGELYIAEHSEQFSKTSAPTLTHASFLVGRPVEMAGMIKIDDGKITEITDNSGHYVPEPLDMYRGIKALQAKMPGVIADDAVLTMYTNTKVTISDFIRDMESPEAYPKHEFLRDSRLAKHKEQLQSLKNKGKYEEPVTWDINASVFELGSHCESLNDDDIVKLSKVFASDKGELVLKKGDFSIKGEDYIDGVVQQEPNEEMICKLSKAVALSRNKALRGTLEDKIKKYAPEFEGTMRSTLEAVTTQVKLQKATIKPPTPVHSTNKKQSSGISL